MPHPPPPSGPGTPQNHHYVYKLCSPSRCALQSGRNPIHVNVLNSPIVQHNPADPVGGFQGMPVRPYVYWGGGVGKSMRLLHA